MPTPRLILSCRLVVFAALLCFASALSAQSEKWKTYKYPEDGLRVSFPVEPKVERSRKEAKSGAILMTSYCAQVGENFLCAAVIDQGAEATGLSPEALLGRTKLGVFSGPKTQKLGETDISLDGYKGVELETVNDTAHIFTRIYMVDKTIYQTMVTLPLGIHYPGTGRFLDSFHLIPRARY